jgi:hypothetical protein
MNKVILTLFALSTVLPISPVASAQKHDFTYAGSDFAASGWLTISGAPSQDGIYENSGVLTWGGTTFSPAANPADGRQDLGSAGNFPNLGGTSTFDYDDLFPTYGAKDTGLDIDGLLFERASGKEFINIWSNDKGNFDSFWTVIDNRWNWRHRGHGGDPGDDGGCRDGRHREGGRNCGNGGNGGNPPPTHVPEYGGLSMLILSALALAGGFLSKTRQSGSLLRA